MAEDSMFHLRWNNHLPNMLSVFRHLFESQTLTDVTLWLDGGKSTVKCHKIILVASSSFFEDIFSSLPQKTHPDIVLPQVTVSDMRPILDFIYRGEINVAAEELKNLLTLANFLKVKGLVTEGNVEDYEKEIDAVISPTPVISKSSSTARHSDHTSVAHSTGGSYEVDEKAQLNLHDQPFSHPIWEYAGHPLDPECNSETTKRRIKEEPPAGESPIIRTMLCQNRSDYSEEASVRRPASCERPYRCRSNESANEHRRHSADFLRMDHNPYGAMIKEEDESSSQGHSRHTHQGSTRHSPVQKAEWKKYKQYSNADLQQALKAMEMGVSPVAASKEFKVPSRTLYDKAKKLGINMKKIKRNISNSNNNSSSAAFPYGIGENVNGRIYRSLSESDYDESSGTFTQHSSSSQNYSTDQPYENMTIDISGSSRSPEIRPVTPDATSEEAVQDLSVKGRCNNGGVIISPPKRELK